MGCKRCIVCFNVCVTGRPKKQTNGDTMQTISEDISDEMENVAAPLQVTYLLQKILEIPKDICSTFAENYGDPCLWIKCCSTCLQLVRSARSIFDQILDLKKNYKELQIEIKNAIELSAKLEKSIDDESEYEPELMVRSYVISQSYQNFNKVMRTPANMDIETLPNVDESLDLEYITLPESNMDAEQMQIECDTRIGLYNSDLVDESDTEVEDPLKIEDTTEEPNGANFTTTEVHEETSLLAQEKYNGEEFMFSEQDYSNNISTTSGLNVGEESATVEKPYLCSSCGKGFDNVGNLKVHVRVHTGEKPYECEICKKCFAHSSDLKRHFRTHTGERPYQCDICSRAFTNSHNLKAHMLTHTTEKGFECDVCRKSFSQYASLKEHATEHTGQKPYECEFCCKKFVRKNNFQHHLNTHTIGGDKPFKCYICDHSFVHSSLLKKHILIHTKDDCFECNFCGKKLTSGGSLKIHLETHAIKRHECMHCDQWFAKSARLKLHLKSHWKTSPAL